MTNKSVAVQHEIKQICVIQRQKTAATAAATKWEQISVNFEQI